MDLRVALLQHRIERLSIPEPNSGCWLWLGVVSKQRPDQKYWRPIISVDGRHRTTHRVSFECANGAVPEGKLVCHTCNNNFCVNPDHLYAGSNKENTQDMMRAGRHFYTANPAAKAALLERVALLHERHRTKQHCKRGHPLSGDNLAIVVNRSRNQTQRRCKTCRRRIDAARARRLRLRKKETSQ